MSTIPQMVAAKTIELYGIHNYEQKFIGVGVPPAGYEPSAHAIINAKYTRVDISGQDDPAQAINLTVNELVKTGIHVDSQKHVVTPYAIELDESTLGKSVVSADLLGSIGNKLKIQSDLLHRQRLEAMAHKLPAWQFDAPQLAHKILGLFDDLSIHFSRQSRKILFLPEVIASRLLGARLASDQTKSEMDVLRDICYENQTFIEQYPTLSTGTVDILLVQHDALAVFSGIEPHQRRVYENPNGLVRTYQFVFSVAGFAPNATTAEANAHVITHLPVSLDTAPAPQSSLIPDDTPATDTPADNGKKK